jgi:hypothetical protein
MADTVTIRRATAADARAIGAVFAHGAIAIACDVTPNAAGSASGTVGKRHIEHCGR